MTTLATRQLARIGSTRAPFSGGLALGLAVAAVVLAPPARAQTQEAAPAVETMPAPATAAVPAIVVAPPTARLIDATDPQAILEIAKGFGSAEIETDNKGDPKIVGRIEGSKYVVLFYGCTAAADCKSIQFVVSWRAKDKMALEKINKYNDDKRFGKAYLDKDGDPTLEFDVNLVGGVTRKNFEETYDWWKTSLVQFAKFLNK